MEKLFDLSGKYAFVTGGAGGIGYAAAMALAQYGAKVTIADYNSELLKESVEKAKQEGIAFNSISLDVSDEKSVIEAVEKQKRLGGIDILINSAAVTIRKKIEDLETSEWNRIINTNLNGAYYIGKHVSELMIEQNRGGRIIYIVSTGAYRASAKFGAYSASKAGVVMLMKTLALELAEYNILCNAIAPTATDTAFTAKYYEENPAIKESVINNHPLKRLAMPEDYQGIVLYLAGNASNFTTGSLFVVDGGKTAK